MRLLDQPVTEAPRPPHPLSQDRASMGAVTLVYASGSRPDRCHHGHSWAPRSGNVLLSWVMCSCPGAMANPSGFGHHRIRCLGDDEKCASVWHDPPHDVA